MPELCEIITYCNERLNVTGITDFPGAENGLQVSNNGNVTRIGASVDAGLVPFQEAAHRKIDLLIVHHGMFWNPLKQLTGVNYDKVKILLDSNIALYSSHLPLDAHPEIGNNAILASKIGVRVEGGIFNYEGTDVGLKTSSPGSRQDIKESLTAVFGQTPKAIEFGSRKPEHLAILTGSGASVLSEMTREGVDTLITGELRQQHFNLAQELGLNLYLCGHYATEIFGVCALATELSQRYGIPWEFVKTDCPL